MVKFFIDPGHGGSDTGAIGNGLLEKNLTLQISKRIRDMLETYENTQVRLSREGDQSLTLNERTNMANSWGADYLLSVHINASGGTGFEDYRYDRIAASSTTGRIQATIHNEIMKAIKKYGVRDRGAKSANFHMLRESNMPAILTENLFIDNIADADLLKQSGFIEALAHGHVNGLAKAFGLKKKSQQEANNVAKNENMVKIGDEGYIVETIQILLNSKNYKLVVDGKFGNQTDAAVKHFQGNKGIPKTGIVEYETWWRLTGDKQGLKW